MAKNTGKPSERIFEERHRALGKRAWFLRLLDAAGVVGRVGKGGYIPPQPSDYIVVRDGLTEFAEVKSTGHASSFSFSLLRPTQSAYAQMILAAGGTYTVYLHDTKRDVWYRFSYELIQKYQDSGRASIPWSDLEGYVW